MVSVSILKIDPDLGEGLREPRRAAAAQACCARVVEVRRGRWSPAFAGDAAQQGFGLLVVSGILCRQVVQSECFGAELIGPGDLLRPWDSVGEWSTLPTDSQWAVLETARLALLDAAFARRASPFPEVAANLAGRALLRSRYLAIASAIISQRRVDKRLMMLFWQLADRFGQTTADGIHIPVPLTHRIISELIAVRRPSVTTSLARLQERGVLERSGRGWLLAGEMPGSPASSHEKPASSHGNASMAWD